MIAIYTLTSTLHDEQAVAAATQEFLGSLNLNYNLYGADYATYGTHPLSLIFVRTGGTEGIFKLLLPQLQSKTDAPFYLLTSGKSNSLAASMEILSFLNQNGLKGEILHGSTGYVRQRIQLLTRIGQARQQLKNLRLGIIGQPSDWLISSSANRQEVKARFGIELVDIPMQQLLDTVAATPLEPVTEQTTEKNIAQALPEAERIYRALHTVISQHRLSGFTLRCFDLLTALRNTGCLALARLNAEGIVAGCEGDVPAMLSMQLAQALLGVTGFQSNPSWIDPETGRLLMAHCTIPLNMVNRYELDTHFESGLGVGIRGYMTPGPVTLFKVSGDLRRSFIAEGQLLECQGKPGLCRTQLLIELADKHQASYFLTNPIGNHHIVVPGHCRVLLEELFR